MGTIGKLILSAILTILFDRDVLEGRPFIDSYRSGGITALIMENTGLVEQALKDGCEA